MLYSRGGCNHVWLITALYSFTPVGYIRKRYALMECQTCGEPMCSVGVPIHPGRTL